MHKAGILILALLCFCSCFKQKSFAKNVTIKDTNFNGKVIVEKIEKLRKYRLSIVDSLSHEIDRIYTPYEIFQLEAGDINYDGKKDICIGIIKPTPFDSVLKKRLFIFQIDKNYIRPLWLSSRLVNPLENFTVQTGSKGQCQVITIERQSKGYYCLNQYKWESFGLAFKKLYADSLSFSKANDKLTNIN